MSKTEMPSIRFYGFDNDWEQRKFDEAFIERRNKTEKENEDILLSCAINGMFLNSELFGHFRGTTTIGYLRVKKNDLILSAQNLHLGNANVNLRFEHGIISPAYKVYDLNNCNPEFVQSWVKRDDTKKFFLAATTEGASQCRKNIEWETLGKQTISMPSLDEQKRIGSFFSQLDNLITLHQRKFEKLTNVKKSMLEKMFPRNGSCYPEIRFKGFTDPWEQRKFGEVFMSLQNNTLSRAELNDEIGAAQNIHYGDVLIKYDEILDVSKEPLSYIEKQSIADKFKTSYLQNGDVIIADTAEDETVGKCTEIEGLTDQKVISGLHTMPVRPNRKFAFGFLGFYLNSAAYHDQLKPLMQGIKVTSISKGAMQDTVVKFPLDLKEQEQIGIYFGGLDHLITLHQCELEKLQSIKKSLLEKMFV